MTLLFTNAEPNAATWTWQADEIDTYTIAARWTSHANRATYEISNNGNTQSVVVNQTQEGGTWNELTSITLNQGDIITISLSNQADGYVIADAIQITPATSIQRNTATWALNTIGEAEYEVYANWTAYPNRATNATFEINTNEGTENITVDQTQNGATWQLLGTYTLNNQSTITLSDQANGYVIADGIKLVPINGSTVATGDKAFYYYHNDHLGTPQALTDQSGNIQWQASYTPFGKADITMNNVRQNLRFPGQYYDEETGFHYNYFRDYDPELGRYLQSDPIGLGGGINTYAYVGGNPLKYTDPYGLLTEGARQIVENAMRSSCNDMYEVQFQLIADRIARNWEALTPAGADLRDAENYIANYVNVRSGPITLLRWFVFGPIISPVYQAGRVIENGVGIKLHSPASLSALSAGYEGAKMPS